MSDDDDKIAKALDGIASSIQWLAFAVVVLANFTMCAGTIHH